MKTIYRTLVLATGAALIATGCASGPGFKETSASLPTLSADKGRVYFFRSGSFAGAAIQPEIHLNGQVVGRSKPGGFFYLDEPPGAYTVSTSTEVEETVDFTLHAGETRYVRTSVSMGLFVGHITPTLEDPQTAPKQLEDLKYTGAEPGKTASISTDKGKM
jgi:hypothetical protein